MKKVKVTAIVCGIISLSATIAFYLLAFKDLFTEPNGWLPLLLLLVAELVGIIKVFAAASSAVCHMDKVSKTDKKLNKKLNKKLSKLNKKYRTIILEDGERRLDNIADLVGRDYFTTKQDVQRLINQEILKNAYINDSRREIMFVASPASPSVNVNVHQLSNTASYPSTDNNISLNKQDSDNSSNHNNADVNSTASVVETETTDNSTNAPAVAVPTIRPRVVSCPCCGANNVVIGDVGQCEYCLAPLA